jgi:hypothetical protein
MKNILIFAAIAGIAGAIAIYVIGLDADRYEDNYQLDPYEF